MSHVMRQLSEEKWVNNEWVADTPSEFRDKLEKVFNLGNIKSEILNLISSQGAHDDVDSATPEDVEDVVTTDSPPPDESTDSG